MNKEILKEIKIARKKAIDGLLKDIGFFEDNRDREETKVKEEDKRHVIRIYRNIDKVSEESSKVDKMNLSKIVSNLNIIGRIREEKGRKEQEYYREKIAKILENKEDLVNRIE